MRIARAVDHIVIAARDLGGLAERYRRLGFQVGALNRHPWGTENHVIQLDGAFLELIGLGADFRAPPPHDPVFPFAGFLADFLARREGLAMVALRSSDAQADRMRFAACGLGERPGFDFARIGRKGDRAVEVAFSLAFASATEFPDAGFFVCQHKRPENFWSAEARRHPNGASRLARLVFTHPDPERGAETLARVFDAGSDAPFSADGALVEALTPQACAAAYGGTPPAAGLARVEIAALDPATGEPATIAL